jgi:hypothetical protein
VSEWTQHIQNLGSKFREADLQVFEQLRGRVRLTGSSAFRKWDPNLEKQLYKIVSN